MTAVDAADAVRAWVNAQTSTLVGVGHPIAHGVYLHRPRSPYGGAYGIVTVVGGTQELTPEAQAHRARVSVSFYGPTKENAEAAARAYALAVLAVPPRTVMGSAVCEFTAAMTGPTEIGTDQEPGYMVDADFYLR